MTKTAAQSVSTGWKPIVRLVIDRLEARHTSHTTDSFHVKQRFALELPVSRETRCFAHQHTFARRCFT